MPSIGNRYYYGLNKILKLRSLENTKDRTLKCLLFGLLFFTTTDFDGIKMYMICNKKISAKGNTTNLKKI